jgi:hypothetical protein
MERKHVHLQCTKFLCVIMQLQVHGVKCWVKNVTFCLLFVVAIRTVDVRHAVTCTGVNM